VAILSWWRGVVASVVCRKNEVTLRRARLVLGWVTVFGRVYHHGTSEQGMGRWVMGQMGHENRMGHMGHGSPGVDP